MTTSSDQTQIHLDAFYPHPKEKVFGAFSQSRALARWIAPAEDIPVRVTTFHFAPEGRFEIEFDVGPETYHLTGQFTKIQAYDALSFTWIWRAPAPHSGIASHVSVRFDDQVGGTRLSLSHIRLDADGMAERHKAGWHGCFERLRKALKESHP